MKGSNLSPEEMDYNAEPWNEDERLRHPGEFMSEAEFRKHYEGDWSLPPDKHIYENLKYQIEHGEPEEASLEYLRRELKYVRKAALAAAEQRADRLHDRAEARGVAIELGAIRLAEIMDDLTHGETERFEYYDQIKEIVGNLRAALNRLEE